MISPIRRACRGHLLALVSRILLTSNRFGATQCAASAVNRFRSLPFSTTIADWHDTDVDTQAPYRTRVPHTPQPDLTSRSTALAQRPSGPASTPAPPSLPPRRCRMSTTPVGRSRARIRRLGHPYVHTPTNWPTSQNSLAVESIDRWFRFDERRALDALRPREPSSGHRSASRRRSPANTPLDVRDRLRPKAIGGVIIALFIARSSRWLSELRGMTVTS